MLRALYTIRSERQLMERIERLPLVKRPVLDLALEAGRPVVLHNRDSWDDLEVALSSRSPWLRGVAHSFTESPERALRVIELGLVVGVVWALATLTERERDIIKLFFGISTQEMTLEEIGEKFGLTRERVRQIKEKAIRRLRHTSRSKLLKTYLG